MQALTLDVILRVVFGAATRRCATRSARALDMTQSLPRLVALSLVPRDVGPPPWRPFLRAVGASTRSLYARAIDRRRRAGDASSTC